MSFNRARFVDRIQFGAVGAAVGLACGLLLAGMLWYFYGPSCLHLGGL